MGQSYSIHIGAYFLCKNTFVEVQRKYNSCKTESCNNFKKLLRGKFCQFCGSEVVQLTKMVSERKVDHNNLLMQIEEKLFEPRRHIDYDNLEQIWTGNEYKSQGHEHDSDYDSEYESESKGLGYSSHDPKDSGWHYKIDAAKVNADINAFNNAFRHQKNILEQAYGPENVTTQWGIFNYFT